MRFPEMHWRFLFCILCRFFSLFLPGSLPLVLWVAPSFPFPLASSRISSLSLAAHLPSLFSTIPASFIPHPSEYVASSFSILSDCYFFLSYRIQKDRELLRALRMKCPQFFFFHSSQHNTEKAVKLFPGDKKGSVKIINSRVQWIVLQCSCLLLRCSFPIHICGIFIGWCHFPTHIFFPYDRWVSLNFPDVLQFCSVMDYQVS